MDSENRLLLVLRNAGQKAHAFSGFANQQTDPLLALHAQIESDLQALTHGLQGDSVLLEQCLTNWTQWLETVANTGSLGSIIENNRLALLSLLPADVRNVCENGFFPYSQTLANLVITEHSWKEAELFASGVLQKREDAMNAAIEANNSRQKALNESREWDAIESSYVCDASTFEWWLIDRSTSCNDLLYFQVRMLWAFANAILEQMPELPADYRVAQNIVRSRIAWVVGPTEARSLVESWHAIENN